MAKQESSVYRKVLFLIIAVFFFAVVFKVIIAEESTLEFTGANIYRAVYAQQLISHAGFASNLQIEGSWRSTGEQFSGEGRILSASKGVFTILYDGRQIMVGGPSTGSEDISARALRIVVQNEDVIRVGIEPSSNTDFSLFMSDLRNIPVQISGENLMETSLRGSISIDSTNTMTPTIAQDLENILGFGSSVTIYDKGLTISLDGVIFNTLDGVSTYFDENNISLSRVSSSRLELDIRTISDSGLSESELSEMAPVSFDYYMLRVIDEPLK
jgi:hypothetical protein